MPRPAEPEFLRKTTAVSVSPSTAKAELEFETLLMQQFMLTMRTEGNNAITIAMTPDYIERAGDCTGEPVLLRNG